MANNSKWNNVFQPIVLMDDGLSNLNSKSQNFCNSNNLMGCQTSLSNGGTSLFDTSPTGFSVSNFGMNINIPTSPIDLFPSTSVFGNESATNGQSQNSSSRQSSTSSMSYSQCDNNSLVSRETGIIEKLLHSYGFIQCCERQARLFFHFSQFNGTIEHLKIGDPVEFEMTYDRRTGKPIASSVTKICPEVLNAERAVGVVTSALKKNSDLQGRITYESSGECFFLPFNKQDVEGNVSLQVGDEVSFQIATNNKGNLSATHVRMENAVNPVKYQGVICSIKQVYGSIERADVVKEIYFHTEQLSRHVNLFCGDDVEFNIRMEHGREMAYNISKLPKGAVIFEDICNRILRGQVLKPIDTSRGFGGDPLAGRLKYRAEDHTEVELPFGLKDQKDCYTLRHGDWVEFNIATDRRDRMDRAVNITLLEDSFQVSGERREQGSVAYVRDHFGFIYPVDKDLQISFSLNEVLSVDKHVEVGDEVEFTIIQECSLTFSNPKKVATRIKLLPKGSIVFDNLVHAHLTGCISRLPLQFMLQGNSFFMDSGLITYHSGGVNCTASLYAKDLNPSLNLKVGDKVLFKLYQIIRNKELIAKDVKGIQQPRMSVPPPRPANEINSNSYVFTSETSQGFIIALKESYGFIEMANLQKEIFFLYKDIDRDLSELDIGMEVEFTIGKSVNKICTSVAKSVKVIPTGTIHGSENILKKLPVVHGKVKRTLRTLNPAQRCYSGLIAEDATNGERGALREFGVMGLKYKQDFIQEGDVVRFQVNCMDQAFNIEIEREIVRSTIASITPGKYGFLSLEVNGKKLFFHISNVHSKGGLEVGDEVECSVVTNQRTGRVAAFAINRISEPQQKLEEPCVHESSVSTSTKTKIIRQPEGPDGNYGFHYKKKHIPFCSKTMPVRSEISMNKKNNETEKELFIFDRNKWIDTDNITQLNEDEADKLSHSNNCLLKAARKLKQVNNERRARRLAFKLSNNAKSNN